MSDSTAKAPSLSDLIDQKPYDPESDDHGYLYGDDTTGRPGCAFAGAFALQSWFSDWLDRFQAWSDSVSPVKAFALFVVAALAMGVVASWFTGPQRPCDEFDGLAAPMGCGAHVGESGRR